MTLPRRERGLDTALICPVRRVGKRRGHEGVNLIQSNVWADPHECQAQMFLGILLKQVDKSLSLALTFSSLPFVLVC